MFLLLIQAYEILKSNIFACPEYTVTAMLVSTQVLPVGVPHQDKEMGGYRTRYQLLQQCPGRKESLQYESRAWGAMQ